MLKILIIGLVTVFILPASIVARGQDYYEFYQQMHTAYCFTSLGDIERSMTIYENAFAKVDYVNTVFLKKALDIAALQEDNEKVTTFSKLIESQRKGIDNSLKTVIDSLINEDQRVRGKKYVKARNYCSKCRLTEKCNTGSKRFLKAQNLLEDWQNTDSTNLKCILNLIRQHGFIGEELVGSAYRGIITILTHFDSDSENEILKPILTEARKRGKILPLHAVQIMDRHHLNKTGTQIYWTWPYASHIKFPFDKKEVIQILELRKSVWIYGSALSQNYKRGYWILENQFEY